MKPVVLRWIMGFIILTRLHYFSVIFQMAIWSANFGHLFVPSFENYDIHQNFNLSIQMAILNFIKGEKLLSEWPLIRFKRRKIARKEDFSNSHCLLGWSVVMAVLLWRGCEDLVNLPGLQSLFVSCPAIWLCNLAGLSPVAATLASILCIHLGY
jgi:hypothetical protein